MSEEPVTEEQVKKLQRVKKTIKAFSVLVWHKIVGGYWSGDIVIHKNALNVVEARKGHWPNRKYELKFPDGREADEERTR